MWSSAGNNTQMPQIPADLRKSAEVLATSSASGTGPAGSVDLTTIVDITGVDAAELAAFVETPSHEADD
jgi:hypothetical protein